MAETSSELRAVVEQQDHHHHNNNNNIPIEIVSEEEMALIEAAFALASSVRSSVSSSSVSAAIRCSSPSPPSSSPLANALPIKSITLFSKRRLSTSSSNSSASASASGNGTHPDIEDSPKLTTTHKKRKVPESFLQRYRRNRSLSVTDLTATEWCQKQMEFTLLHGRRKTNKAMRAGIARHAKLEEEVIKRVAVKVTSQEDHWALKLLNFINGVNRLLFEGLTRELPVIGFANGIWMVGVIDEIQMPLTENDHNPLLVDTKTRSRDTLPSEPQRRNGRLQLMCYKYLWDNLVADDFPSKKFFTSFDLNPQHSLSEDLIAIFANSGFSASTLDDVVRYYTNTCRMLAPAHNHLLLRYEYQGDHSLLGEDKFEYDPEWLKDQISGCLKFWHGQQEASFAPEDERWKCRYCQFRTDCPAYTDSSERMNDDSNIKGIA